MPHGESILKIKGLGKVSLDLNYILGMPSHVGDKTSVKLLKDKFPSFANLEGL
jgi:endonuclease III-like uncharacterized protein